MVLPATDGYALFLVTFFVELDGYAELTCPRKPPAPKWVSDEWLQNSRRAAYEEALKRWESGYLQPWQQRKERHDKQKRAERLNTLRTRAAAGDETAMQRQDSERDRISKSVRSLRKRTSEAAAGGDETAMQRQDSERDRKKKSEKSSRNRTSEAAAAGDATAMQRRDSERDRKKKSMQSSRKRTSEAAAAGDATAMQWQDSERDRKRQCRDEERSIQSDGASFTSRLDVMMLDVKVQCATLY